MIQGDPGIADHLRTMFQKAAELQGVDEWHPGELYDSGDSIITIPDVLQGAWIAVIHDAYTPIRANNRQILHWPCEPDRKPTQNIRKLRDIASNLIRMCLLINWADNQIDDIEEFVAEQLPEGKISHRQQDTSNKHMSAPEEPHIVYRLADALSEVVDKGDDWRREVGMYEQVIPMPPSPSDEQRNQEERANEKMVQAREDLRQAIDAAKDAIPKVDQYVRQMFNTKPAVWSSDLKRRLTLFKSEVLGGGPGFVSAEQGQRFRNRLDYFDKCQQDLHDLDASALAPPAGQGGGIDRVPTDVSSAGDAEQTASIEDRQVESSEAGESESQPDDKGFVLNPSDPSGYRAATEIIRKYWRSPPLRNMSNKNKELWNILNAEPTIRRWRPGPEAPPKYRKYKLCVNLNDWLGHIDRLDKIRSEAEAIAAGKQHWRCKKCRKLFLDKPCDARCPDPECRSDDIEPVMTR
ncbi:MAG: hypothetical protein QGH60_05940 [Phycisphaerae bacterium]|jgi:hypothetical protein|nr:hypothetical protein [Phycisphaerae bacterium]